MEKRKTSKRGISKFFSQIFRRSATPDSSITKQATENTQQQQLWIRKEPDADGYFLLQLADTYNDMFLTSDDATSLTIACKLC